MTPKQQVEHWNKTVGVGDGVYVVKGAGNVLETATRAKAQVLSDGSAVVWVDNHVGAVPLEKVRANGNRASQVVAMLAKREGVQ